MPDFLDTILSSARKATSSVLGEPPAKGKSIISNVAGAAASSTEAPAYDKSKGPGNNVLGALLGPGKTTAAPAPAPAAPAAPPKPETAEEMPKLNPTLSPIKSSSVLSVLFGKRAAATKSLIPGFSVNDLHPDAAVMSAETHSPRGLEDVSPLDRDLSFNFHTTRNREYTAPAGAPTPAPAEPAPKTATPPSLQTPTAAPAAAPPAPDPVPAAPAAPPAAAIPNVDPSWDFGPDDPNAFPSEEPAPSPAPAPAVAPAASGKPLNDFWRHGLNGAPPAPAPSPESQPIPYNTGPQGNPLDRQKVAPAGADPTGALFSTVTGSTFNPNSRTDVAMAEKMRKFIEMNPDASSWTPNTFARNFYRAQSGKTAALVSILFKSAAPAPAGGAPAVTEPGGGTPVQSSWDEAAKPSAASQAFRQQENAARGQEEFVGASPQGEGWQAIGSRSGQPVWSRQTPAGSQPPAAPQVAAAPAKTIPGITPAAAPTGPVATNVAPVTPPGASGNAAVDGYEKDLGDYHNYQTGTTTGADLDRSFADSQKALGAVNANLDSYAQRSGAIWNPRAAAAHQDRVLKSYGFNPGFNTFRAANRPSKELIAPPKAIRVHE